MNKTDEKIFAIDAGWSTQYPQAKAGILVIKDIQNTNAHPELGKLAAKVETLIREQFKGFSRESLNALPIISSYNAYYKNFGKTYHVRAQVESIVNGKSLSSSSAVVTAMFIAEVKNMLLTAGHDYGTLDLPIRIATGAGTESFIDIRGAQKTVLAGDMMMADGKGVISSIVNGPDGRTKLTASVRDVLFAVYAPSAVSAEIVRSHLIDIETYVKAFSPDATTQFLEVFEAS
jgi:DNA/RNA-binding domain of Phe-tRNA-synthetase-like protein